MSVFRYSASALRQNFASDGTENLKETYRGRRVRQTSLHANHTAGEYSTKAVGVEAGAKDSLNLVLQDAGNLITAEVGHSNGVITSEAEAGESNLEPTTVGERHRNLSVR